MTQTKFQAKRPQDVQIEMVLVEATALLFLTSLGKAMQTMHREQKLPDTSDSHTLDVSIMLAEKALGVSAKARAAQR